METDALAAGAFVAVETSVGQLGPFWLMPLARFTTRRFQQPCDHDKSHLRLHGADGVFHLSLNPQTMLELGGYRANVADRVVIALPYFSEPPFG